MPPPTMERRNNPIGRSESLQPCSLQGPSTFSSLSLTSPAQHSPASACSTHAQCCSVVQVGQCWFKLKRWSTVELVFSKCHCWLAEPESHVFMYTRFSAALLSTQLLLIGWYTLLSCKEEAETLELWLKKKQKKTTTTIPSPFGGK